VAFRNFHTSYTAMDLRPDELIARIRLPRRNEDAGRPREMRGEPGATSTWHDYYRKVGTRRAQAISKVCFAGLARTKSGRIADVRIAVGSVAPIPLRCEKTEAVLQGQKPEPDVIRAARETLAREIAPIDDFRSTARYRSRVSQNLLEEFLQSLTK
jgi:CO/xanthine dehydrogenase FAD-binding subunit